MADFLVVDEGTIILFEPMTDEAAAWWSENCETGMSMGAAYAVDHRCAQAILEGLDSAGFTILRERKPTTSVVGGIEPTKKFR
jgi:hypothetical protein